MLLRHQQTSAIAITQPSHSWLSGQLARARGNDQFERPTPFEAFYFATELHDIGWADHDRCPVFDPNTGFPRTFWDVPATEHTALWSEGVDRALAFGRYPAMIISLHAKTIGWIAAALASLRRQRKLASASQLSLEAGVGCSSPLRRDAQLRAAARSWARPNRPSRNWALARRHHGRLAAFLQRLMS